MFYGILKMNERNLIHNNNDILKESNFSQQTSFVTQDNNQEPNNTHLNDKVLINSVPQVEPENNDQSEVIGQQSNMKHIRRRSKKVVEGRNYICKICSKSYLSYPALYTHSKQKHNTNSSYLGSLPDYRLF